MSAGIALYRAMRFAEAVEVFEAIVQRFAGASDGARRRLAVLALDNIAGSLAQLGRLDEVVATHERVLAFGEDAVGAFDESAQSCRGRTEPAARVQLVKALIGKATVLSHLDRRDEALGILSDVIARAEDDDDPVVRSAGPAAIRLRDEIRAV